MSTPTRPAFLATPLVALALLSMSCLPHGGPTPSAPPPVTAVEPPRPPDPPRTEPVPRQAPKTEPAAVKKPTRATPELQAQRKKRIDSLTGQGGVIHRVVPTSASLSVEDNFWNLPAEMQADLMKTAFDYVYSLPADYKPDDVFPGAVLWVDNLSDRELRTYTADFGVQKSDGNRHPDRVRPMPPAGWQPPG